MKVLRLRHRVKIIAGWLLNLSGLPGFARECDYSSRVSSARVRVRVTPTYTVVNANGLDIYFDRLSGVIDGVGVNPTSDCKVVSARE